MNIYANAVKFCNKGNIQISCRFLEKDSQIEVSVKDTGIGISKENQKKLFQLFGTMESDGANTSGIGLGLFISKQIVSQFDGSINVISQLGEGSEFYFTFSVEREDTPEFNFRKDSITKASLRFKGRKNILKQKKHSSPLKLRPRMDSLPAIEN